jgi:hypothetical protein
MTVVCRARLRGVLVATTMASTLAVSPAAFADGGGTFNNADVVIRGGKGVAVAVCVNWAQDWTKLSPKQQKRHEQRRVVQANRCDDTANTADALGGDVTLTGVDVTIDQAGGHHVRRSTASITIAGGDAVAVAACINVLDATASATQTNDCGNTAIATGGNVTLEDTTVTIIQG